MAGECAVGLFGGFTHKMKSVQDFCSRIQPHHRLSTTDCEVRAHPTSYDQKVVSLNLADSKLLETAYHSDSAAYALWSMNQSVTWSRRDLRVSRGINDPKSQWHTLAAVICSADLPVIADLTSLKGSVPEWSSRRVIHLDRARQGLITRVQIVPQ